MKMQFVVAVGDLNKGYQFWGPFDLETDAEGWLRYNSRHGGTGEVRPLFVPEEQ